MQNNEINRYLLPPACAANHSNSVMAIEKSENHTYWSVGDAHELSEPNE